MFRQPKKHAKPLFVMQNDRLSSCLSTSQVAHPVMKPWLQSHLFWIAYKYKYFLKDGLFHNIFVLLLH